MGLRKCQKAVWKSEQRKAIESCREGFEGFDGFILKPNRNSLWRFGNAREQFGSPSSERQSKAAGKILRVLKVLRGAENVPDSSFEAQ